MRWMAEVKGAVGRVTYAVGEVLPPGGGSKARGLCATGSEEDDSYLLLLNFALCHAVPL